jgi:hypothetical protein
VANPTAPRAPTKSRVALPNRSVGHWHRPACDPSSRRNHAISQSPLNAPPGRCRSTLALGPIRAPTHRKPAWRLHLASSSLFDGPVLAVLPQISSCPGLQRTGVVRAGRYPGGRGRGVWVSVAKPRPLSRQSPFRHHPCAPALRATLSISGIISVVVRQAAAYAGLNHRGSGRHERRGGLAVRNHPADGLRAGAELASHHHP